MNTIKTIFLATMLVATPQMMQSADVSEKYQELPIGQVKAGGWLQDMLVRQRDGITLHLDENYPQVLGPSNGWLGGDGDQWERGPYWIDGALPLAYLLDDQVLKAKVANWVEHILNSQIASGDFGPQKDGRKQRGLNTGNARDWWPRMVALKILKQHYNATQDKRVLPFLLNYFRYQLKELPNTPIGHWTFWGEYRVCDEMDVVLWAYEHTHEAFLLDLVELLHKQSHDFTHMFLETDELATFGTIHCVNLAQGLKEPIVYWRLNRGQRYLDAVKKGMHDIRKYNGTPNGMYGGDEALHGNDPVQGSELCSAIEMMYSMELMMRATGNLDFVDQLERVAYNALPTQCSPDMKLHQYFQQTNQVDATYGNHHFDVSNDQTSLVYGFLSGYPCCLCNMHQGWPKFVQNLWLRAADGGLAALAFGPSQVSVELGGKAVTIKEITDYPMDGTIRFEVGMKKKASVTFPLHLRIPQWTENAVLTINGEAVSNVVSGQVKVINREWHNGDVVELQLPMKIQISRWFENAATVERGPLVFALKIDEQWKRKALDATKGHGSECWEITAGSPWNYGLLKSAVDKPQEKMRVIIHPERLNGHWAWDNASAPIEIETEATPISTWTLNNGDTGRLPYSATVHHGVPFQCALSVERIDKVTLIPYGCTRLRITEFPVIR